MLSQLADAASWKSSRLMAVDAASSHVRCQFSEGLVGLLRDVRQLQALGFSMRRELLAEVETAGKFYRCGWVDWSCPQMSFASYAFDCMLQCWLVLFFCIVQQRPCCCYCCRYGMVLQQCAHFYNNIATEMIPCQKPLMLADAVEFEKVRGLYGLVVWWFCFL